MGKWSHNQIAMVGALSTRWPDEPVQHFTKPREAIDAVKKILTEADEAMSEIESDPGLNEGGIKSRRAAVGQKYLDKLQALPELSAADAATSRRVEALRAKQAVEVKADNDPQIAAEIRNHVKNSESPAMTAMALRNDKRAVAALLDAPAFLSGLKNEEQEALRATAVRTTPQAADIAQIENVQSVYRGAVKSAKAMIQERSGVTTADFTSVSLAQRVQEFLK